MRLELGPRSRRVPRLFMRGEPSVAWQVLPPPRGTGFCAVTDLAAALSLDVSLDTPVALPLETPVKHVADFVAALLDTPVALPLETPVAHVADFVAALLDVPANDAEPAVSVARKRARDVQATPSNRRGGRQDPQTVARVIQLGSEGASVVEIDRILHREQASTNSNPALNLFWILGPTSTFPWIPDLAFTCPESRTLPKLSLDPGPSPDLTA
jgi:hypothetical protein